MGLPCCISVELLLSFFGSVVGVRRYCLSRGTITTKFFHVSLILHVGQDSLTSNYVQVNFSITVLKKVVEQNKIAEEITHP